MNPPQNPTAKKVLHSGLRTSLCSESAYIIPMKKQPMIFTSMVPKGKLESICFCTNNETKYLEMLPKKPPDPTINKTFNINSLT